MIKDKKTIIKSINFIYQLKAGEMANQALENKEVKYLTKKIKDNSVVMYETTSGHSVSVTEVRKDEIVVSDTFKGTTTDYVIMYGSYKEIFTRMEVDLVDNLRIEVR